MNTLRIAVDLMGGDMGVHVTLPAVTTLALQHPDIQFQLYGEIQHQPVSSQSLATNISFIPTEDSVAMNEPPVHALRHKRSSSMAKALSAVADGDADGCVSAGNTGALVALALHYFKKFDGIDRPAFCQAMPVVSDDCSAGAMTYMLDLGANTDCSPQQLRQFAALGIALSEMLHGESSPSVKLLNIGSEDFKGSRVVQAAAELFTAEDAINYQGFIEADQLYQGSCRVIVCDGFVGNIALKASEGVARLLTDKAREAFSANIYQRLVGFLAKPMLGGWYKRMNPDSYNGAYLLGINGAVVKSHGSANVAQFSYAVSLLIHQLRQESVASMESRVREVLCLNATDSST